MFFSYPKEPALHLAVLSNQPERVAELIAVGADFEEVNALELKALDLAMLLNRTHCLALLAPNLSAPKIPFVLAGQRVRTVYSLADLQEKTGLTYLRYPKFQDYQTLKRAIKHLPYFLKHGSIGDYCCEMAYRYRNEISQGHCADMTAVWMNEAVGFGLMTNRHLEEGCFVGLYTGVVRPLDWLGASANAWCMRYPQGFFTLRHLVIDALAESNLLRFANHSESPNLTPHYAVDRGIVYVLFLANQFIPRGSWLTFDYGQDFWRRRIKT